MSKAREYAKAMKAAAEMRPLRLFLDGLPSIEAECTEEGELLIRVGQNTLPVISAVQVLKLLGWLKANFE